MGLFRDLVHVAGNLMKVNSLWHDVRIILIRESGIDVELLPNERKMALYNYVKNQYLDGNSSAESIAILVKLHAHAAASN